MFRSLDMELNVLSQIYLQILVFCKFFPHLLPQSIPIWQMFQGGANGLYVPQHQEQEEQTAHETGSAIKILYGLHNALCGIYGHTASQVVGYVIAHQIAGRPEFKRRA